MFLSFNSGVISINNYNSSNKERRLYKEFVIYRINNLLNALMMRLVSDKMQIETYYSK